MSYIHTYKQYYLLCLTPYSLQYQQVHTGNQLLIHELLRPFVHSQANYIFVYLSGILQLQNKTGEAIWWPCQLKM